MYRIEHIKTLLVYQSLEFSPSLASYHTRTWRREIFSNLILFPQHQHRPRRRRSAICYSSCPTFSLSLLSLPSLSPLSLPSFYGHFLPAATAAWGRKRILKVSILIMICYSLHKYCCFSRTLKLPITLWTDTPVIRILKIRSLLRSNWLIKNPRVSLSKRFSRV